MKARLNPKTAVRILVTVLFLAILAAVVDLRATMRILAEADPLLLVLGIVVSFGDRVFMAAKWIPLLRAQSVHARVASVVRVYLATSFAGIFLPASVGADVLRTVGIGRRHNAVPEVGASILVERILGLMGSAVMGVAALGLAFAFSIDLAFVVPWAMIAVLAPVALVALPQLPGVRGFLDRWTTRRKSSGGIAAFVRRFGAAYLLYRDHRGAMVLVGILSVLEQLAPVAVLWVMAASLGIAVTAPMLLVAVPLALFVNRLPIAFSSFGVMEGALVYLLGLFGVPPAEALALSLAGRVAEVAAALPGAFYVNELAARAGSDDPSRTGAAGRDEEEGRGTPHEPSPAFSSGTDESRFGP